ncbi:endoplasmic reticulum-based factor for assembly of V-ATPase-domain-containing protein [Dichotomocladium elegans]|nr:endoplasmic reticulum-based factor for assembly of V-ATPase-domain-containing protein [Dichotomocladium elegans]
MSRLPIGSNSARNCNVKLLLLLNSLWMTAITVSLWLCYASSQVCLPGKNQVKATREAIMQRIRDEQQNREYAAMVSSVVTSESERFSLGFKPDEVKEIKSHIATIFNIGFSAAAVFTAVYVASRTMTDDPGIRMLLSLAGAILIVAVEATLYISYAQRATAPPKKKSSKSKK